MEPTKSSPMHFLRISDYSREWIEALIRKTLDVKANPSHYATRLSGKTLLMLFEKPSLRTRLSFEVGMTQLGGHAIYYHTATGPFGKKESIADTAATASRFVDAIMARMFNHEDLVELAENSNVPVINGLTNYNHPCQILSDLFTIHEEKGDLAGLKIAYFGDGCNNVTHSLMAGATLMGMHIAVACPGGETYEPSPEVVAEAHRLAEEQGGSLLVTRDPKEAAANADVIYTDSWMSYHIPAEQEPERVRIFSPYQVTQEIMAWAKEDAVFMNCLPARRGYEQTAEVIDGPQSIIFDQAENRLHVQKALLIELLAS